MIRYPLAYNPILDYWNDIETGKAIVSKKIRRTYEKVVADLANNKSDYYYNPKRANHVIEFAENFCKHSKGKYGGKPVILELWEKAMLATVFGFVTIDGIRKYRKVLFIVGKKNGKSLLSSVVGLYMLVADGEPGPEVYAVATKRDQAKIIWQEAKRMVKKSPSLLKRIKPLVGELTSEDFNSGTFKPLASDSDTLDGLNVHAVLMDEIHQWRNGIALHDIMVDGMGAREQPLAFITSTAGTVREDLYDSEYEYATKVIQGYDQTEVHNYVDERYIAFIYEIDKRDEWQNEECWYKANPGLGTIKSLEILRDKVEKAKQNPNFVKNLVCKEFNIPETSSEAWLTWEQLNNTETFDISKIKARYGIGGADLSSTTDLTAAKVIFMVPGTNKIFVISMYWIPEDLVEKKVREDQIRYDLWIEQGICRTSKGNKVDYSDVTAWFIEVQQELDIHLFAVGYDSWSAQAWVKEMSSEFGYDTMIPIHQGKKTLSSPMKNLGADLDKKVINYNNNPIDKWCLANTSYEEDKNGNIQPHKTSRSTLRIDGTAALLNAYVVLEDNFEEYMSYVKRGA